MSAIYETAIKVTHKNIYIALNTFYWKSLRIENKLGDGPNQEATKIPE